MGKNKNALQLLKPNPKVNKVFVFVVVVVVVSLALI